MFLTKRGLISSSSSLLSSSVFINSNTNNIFIKPLFTNHIFLASRLFSSSSSKINSNLKLSSFSYSSSSSLFNMKSFLKSSQQQLRFQSTTASSSSNSGSNIITDKELEKKTDIVGLKASLIELIDSNKVFLVTKSYCP